MEDTRLYMGVGILSRYLLSERKLNTYTKLSLFCQEENASEVLMAVYIVLCPECGTIQKAGEICPNCTYPIPLPVDEKPNQKKRTEQVLDLSYQDEKKEKNLEASIKLISSVVKKLEEQISKSVTL